MKPNTKPVGPYEDFDACVAANRDKEDPQAYCAAIERNQYAQERLEEVLRAGVSPDVFSERLRQWKEPKERRYFQAWLKGVDEDDFEADIVLNNADMDRDKEIVDPKGMVLPKPKRIPLVSSHQYGDLRKQIGDVPRVKVNGEVTARPRWFAGMGNPEADWAFELVKMGVAAFSIGFIPIEWEDADLTDEKVLEKVIAGKIPLRRFTKWELAEVSQVIVPSNRGAVQRMVEAGILQKDYKLDGLKDEPMEAKAQEAFEAALKNWKTKQEQTTAVEVVADPVPPPATEPVAPEVAPVELTVVSAPEEEQKVEVAVEPVVEAAKPDAAAVAAAPAAETPKAEVDLLKLFADAAEKKPEPDRPSQRVRKDADEVVVQVRFDEDILPRIQEALSQFAVEFREEVAASLNAALADRDEALKDLEARMGGVVLKVVSDMFGPDSAAHTKTKDLISAVATGLKEHVDLLIARAKGNVDAWT